MHRYVLMGPQGCGKGTQATLLAELLEVPHLSSGEMFRRAVAAGTPLGRRVAPLLAAGQLVPDDLTIATVEERLARPDCARGFILDGFPRDRAQAEALLARHEIDALILIDVDDEVVTARALARRHCSSCGRDHNLLTCPPREEGRCDNCGGALQARDDDTPEGVAHRLAAYHASTEPAFEPFRRRGLVRRVDGVGTIDEVARRIRDALGLAVVQAA